MGQKQILILGAGFGGLRAATCIAKKLRELRLESHWRVALVDRSEHHTFTPLLYEAASISKQTADLSRLHDLATYHIGDLIAGLPITFYKQEVVSMNVATRSAVLGDGQIIKGEYLVLALGSETNYFGIPGLREHSLTLKTFADAIKVRDTIWNLAQDGTSKIHVAVGGAGATGVELAAEIRMWGAQLKTLFPKCRLIVNLIEGQDTILPGFPIKFIAKVRKRLEWLGVHITTGTKITSVDERFISLDANACLQYEVLVWTGGIKASSIASDLPLRKDGNRLQVDSNMSCLADTQQIPDLQVSSRVYALGDSVCFHDPRTGKLVPWVARAAIMQADVVAHNIVSDICFELGMASSPSHVKFTPRNYPYIVPVGGKYSVAHAGSFVFAGAPAWIFKLLVELYYLLSLMPPRKAFALWRQSIKVFSQNEQVYSHSEQKG